MTIDSTNSAGSSLPASYDSNSKPKADSKSTETNKATQVFKKALTPEEKEAIRLDDREYLIEDIMATKGVSRRIAELEYEFLN